MKVTSEPGQGDKVNISFPLQFSIVVGIVVVTLTAAFYFSGNSISQTAIFLGTATAAGGSVCIAFYTGRMLSLSITQEGRSQARESHSIDQAKKERALRFAERWNEPQMYHARDTLRHLFDNKNTSDEDIKNIAEDRKTNMIQILNFAEEIAYAYDNDLVDRELTRDKFEGIILTLWQTLEPWVRKHRSDRGRTKIWARVESLYHQWKG